MTFAGIFLGFAIGLILFIRMVGTRRLSDWREKSPDSPDPAEPGPSASWNDLTGRAERTVQAAQAELPEDVRLEALQVPTVLEEWHPDRRGILGVYHNVASTDLAGRKGPIVLYLRAIESYAGRLGFPFEDQVRKTYLHELGHHVGWNEGQVRERGL
jgi:predicted Zn-dependent protease with MMP-like domain